MGTVNDRRADKGDRLWFVVATDTFLSGWGKAAGGRSLYALACGDHDAERIIRGNMAARSDMKRPRLHTRGLAKLIASLGPNDHLSIADEKVAPYFYVEGGFTK